MRQFTVTFDREAVADLVEIRNYIAKARNLEFADAFTDRIVGYCEGFGALPHRGTKPDDIRTGLRTVSWRRTVTIAFSVSDHSQRVTILGIFYRGRDIDSVLRKRS